MLVTRGQYDAVEFCPNYRVTSLDPPEISLIPVDYSHNILLQCSDKGYKTVRDNNMFKVSDAYSGLTDFWTSRGIE